MPSPSHDDTSLIQTLHDLHRRHDITSLEDFFTLPFDSLETLLDRMQAGFSESKSAPARYSTTTFDADDVAGTRYVPHRQETSWSTLDSALEFFDIKNGMLFSVPFFWHIEPLAHTCCRNAGIPIATVPPTNMALAVEAVRQIGAEAMVGTPESIRLFLDETARRNISHDVRLFVCVMPHTDHTLEQVRADLVALTRGKTLLMELHIFPGFPLFTQTLVLADSTTPEFALNKEYHIEEYADGIAVTGTSLAGLPCIRYPVPIHVVKKTGANTPETYTVSYE